MKGMFATLILLVWAAASLVLLGLLIIDADRLCM